MNRLQKPQNSLRWFLIFLSLGLHGLVLSLPIDHEKPEEKPRSTSVKVVPLPKQPSSLAVIPKPSPSKASVATFVPKRALPKPVARVKAPLITIPQEPVSRSLPPASSAPTPISPPASSAPVTPSTPVQPVPTPSPDVFQVEGAIACEGIKDCYASAETNGREISQTLEQQLQAKGYTLQPLDLDEDTGMKVYRLFRQGQARDYLHIIWTDQGTRSLRLPKPVKNRQALAAVAQLVPQDL
ncbi:MULTISPECIES: hypothetical protein [Cyanophyceae]|uniref:Filamentous hemagglutinin n=1 Tax=Stenomitos frigidus AS-A4 TaxID=2933935 RepID=A0ABV0KH75_9CYAN|nr:hypothetical protein [Phormidium sp. FACHB-592]